MEAKFKDYGIANISPEEVQSLTELEDKLKEKIKKEIVLIAYQPKDSTVM